jgi:hypothetical protein
LRQNLSFDTRLTAGLNQIAVLRANYNAAPALRIERLHEIQGAELNAAHRRCRLDEDDGFALVSLHTN